MKSIKYTILLNLSFVLLGITSCEKIPSEPTVSEKLQRILEVNLEEYQGKGISATVDFNNGFIWTGACGISGKTQAITDDMVFGIGSVTKTFIAALCLQLAEENVIQLEESLNKWLPDYPNIDSAVTVRQLLTNTSGIYNLSDNNELWDAVFEAPDKKWTFEELMETYVLSSYADPGEGWYYSNTNYILLGEIIRRATGTDVSLLLRTRFFGPLGLDNTYFAIEEQLPSEIAHAWFDLSGDGSYDDASLLPETGIYSVLWTSAAIFSTTEDLSKWCNALLMGEVLSDSGLQDMLHPFPGLLGSTEVEYGMGIYLISSKNNSGVGLLGSTGRTFGYLTAMFFIPDFGISVCVMLNNDDSEFLDSVTTELIIAAVESSKKLEVNGSV